MSKFLTHVLKAFHNLTLPITPASFLSDLLSPAFSFSFFKTQFSHYFLQGVFLAHYPPHPLEPPQAGLSALPPGSHSFPSVVLIIWYCSCPLCLLPLGQHGFAWEWTSCIFSLNPSIQPSVGQCWAYNRYPTNEQHCIRTWKMRSVNQGKLEVVKQEMARVSIDILGISELKWTGMGKFNSDDSYLLLWSRIP